MRRPPEYLQPLLHSIESTTATIYKEFPRLSDKDVEWCYGKLMDYFKAKAKGKTVEEPLSPSEMKQALIDEILNIIEAREEIDGDSHLIDNPNVRLGEYSFLSLEQVYATAFNSLKGSARFWRKKDGRNGYLKYISNFII